MLTDALDDPDVSVRRRALEVTAAWAAHPASEPAGDPPAEYASRAGGPRATEPEQDGRQQDGRTVLAGVVIQLTADPAVAEIAAFALGELGVADPAVEATLRALATGHDDPLVRESAVAALGSLGVGLDAVLSATGDIAAVRRRAVVALAAFDGEQVDRALERALGDRDWQVRQIAEDLLQDPPG
ncbi:MAG: HEAT repeat domain-containing protein [Acidimicrobiales bacterium]